MPRALEFTQEIADAICERIASGESLRSICADESMPSTVTVFKWLGLQAAFANQYALAREAQADALFDEMLSIADDGTNDWMLSRGEDENEAWRVNGEHIQRSKLRLEARKWMASKLQPKKYGDKITQELTGAGGAPLVPVLNVTISKPGSGTPPKAG